MSSVEKNLQVHVSVVLEYEGRIVAKTEAVSSIYGRRNLAELFGYLAGEYLLCAERAWTELASQLLRKWHERRAEPEAA